MELTKSKVSYEPFTSIDIECSGLNPEIDTIIEVGAAFYDGIHKEPVATAEFLCIPNDAPELDVNYRISGQPIALVMNAAILTEITNAIKERLRNPPNDPTELLRSATGQLILSESEGMTYLFKWMEYIQIIYKLKKKHILLGKNLNALDVPFLKKKMGKERWDKVTSFRNLCLTSLFAPFSRKTSPLKDINALRGLGVVSHRALQDARETGDAVIDIYEKNLQW